MTADRRGVYLALFALMLSGVLLPEQQGDVPPTILIPG